MSPLDPADPSSWPPPRPGTGVRENVRPDPEPPLPDATAVGAPSGPSPEEGPARRPLRSGKAEGMPWVRFTAFAGILGFVGLFVAGLIVGPLGAVVLFGPEALEDSDPAAAPIVAQLLLGLTWLAGSVLLIRNASSPGGAESLGFRRFRPSAFGWLALGYLSYIGVAIVVTAVLQPEQQDISEALGADEGTLALVLAGMLVVVLAPLAEEALFRGVLHAGLRKALAFIPAALISGIAFGAIHYTEPESLGLIPQLGFFGIVLAWLYEKTGSLWPPIGLHALNNAIAFTLLITGVTEELQNALAFPLLLL